MVDADRFAARNRSQAGSSSDDDDGSDSDSASSTSTSRSQFEARNRSQAGRVVDDDDDDDDGGGGGGGGGISRTEARRITSGAAQDTSPEAHTPTEEEFEAQSRSQAGEEADRDPSSGFRDPNRVELGEIEFDASGTALPQGEKQDLAETGGPRAGVRGEARQFENQILLNTDLDRSDVRVTRTLSGLEARLAGDARRQAIQRQVARQFDRQLPDVNVTQEDVEVRGDRARLTEEFRRQQRQRQEQRIEQQLEAAVTRRRFGLTPDEAASIPVVGGALSNIVERADLERGRDFRVERTGQGVRTELTQGFREREAERRFRQMIESETGVETSGLEEGEDFEVGVTEVTEEDVERVRDAPFLSDRLAENLETGSVTRAELTPRGRRSVIRSRIAEQGSFTVEGRSVDIPVIGEISTGDKEIPIEDVDEQLEFDEEGNLVGVSRPPRPSMEERVERLQSKGVHRSLAIGLAGSLETVEGVGDLSKDVGGFVGEKVLVPAGEVTGKAIVSPVAAQQRITEGPEAAGEVLEVGEKFGRGGGRLLQSGIELPSTVASGVGAAGEAGAFVVENPLGESLAAAGGATVDVGEQVAVASAKKPFETTGMLVGSGALFSASRAVGSRTNVATRAAIQPGEELLGKGGAAAFGRAGSAAREVGQRAPGRPGAAIKRAGAGTERAGSVLFPRGEPLFASEEAAIFAGRRVVRAGRRGAAGVRRRASGFEAPSVTRQRVLTPRGLTTETSVELGTVGSVAGAAGQRARSVASRARRLRLEAEDELRRRTMERPPKREMGEVTAPTVIEVEGGEARGAIVEEVPGQTEATDLGPFEAEGEADVGEGDGGTIGSNVLMGEIAVETESGVVVERVMGEVETESETEIGAEARRRGVESAPSVEIAVGEESLVAETQPSEILIEQGIMTGLEAGLEAVPRQESRLEPIGEIGFEMGREQRGEAEQEFEREIELESEVETESELELELETETELEQELEVETFRDEDEKERMFEDVGDGDFLKEFEGGVADPTTVAFGEDITDPVEDLGPE